MTINWEKKKTGLRWGVGCGICVFIDQAFMEENIFQGKNALWDDLLLSALCFAFPILFVFLLYWPKQKPVQNKSEQEERQKGQ